MKEFHHYHLFRAAFPHLTYQSSHAKSRLLQMPIAALPLGSPSSGFAEVKLMEYVPGVDYLKVHHFLKGAVVKCGKTPSISKQFNSKNSRMC